MCYAPTTTTTRTTMCSALCCSLRKRKLQSAQTLLPAQLGRCGRGHGQGSQHALRRDATLCRLQSPWSYICALLPTLERAPECVAAASELIRTRCGTVHSPRRERVRGRMGSKRWGSGSRNSILSRHATLLSIWLISFEPPALTMLLLL